MNTPNLNTDCVPPHTGKKPRLEDIKNKIKVVVVDSHQDDGSQLAPDNMQSVGGQRGVPRG